MYTFCALRSTVSQPEDEVRDVVPSSLLNVLSCQSFVIHSLQGVEGERECEELSVVGQELVHWSRYQTTPIAAFISSFWMNTLNVYPGRIKCCGGSGLVSRLSALTVIGINFFIASFIFFL